MTYYYTHSALTGKGACNHCDEDHRWYLYLLEDGGIIRWYEGCGGMMGRAFERRGENVDRDKAISELEGRIEELHEERRELFDNLHAVEKMLKRLKRAGQVSE